MHKKTILITGGSRGIGREIALKFALNGFSVATCGRDAQKLDSLKIDITNKGGTILTAICDVQNPAEIKSFVQEAADKFKTIDVLINSAGIFLPGQIHKEEPGVYEQTMRTNVDATYHFCREVIPFMSASDKPHIFNICSTASIIAYPNGGSYCISKYAQYGLTKVLREELKPKGISVTAVLPGATYTDSWRGTDLPESRFIKPETIAKVVWNAYDIGQDGVVEDLLIRPMLGDIL